MTTATYQNTARRPDIQARALEVLVARIRRRQNSRSPEEAQEVTLEAIRRWKAREQEQRGFLFGKGRP